MAILEYFLLFLFTVDVELYILVTNEKHLKYITLRQYAKKKAALPATKKTHSKQKDMATKT